MSRNDRLLLAGGLAMALVALCSAAALVWLAIESTPGPAPVNPFDPGNAVRFEGGGG